MELRTLGAPSVRLLSADEPGNIYNTDTELGAARENVEVEGSTNCDAVVAVALVCSVLSVSAVMFYFLMDLWQSQSHYRVWILMACTAPLSFVAGHANQRCRHVWAQWGCIRVVLDSMRSGTLFNAVTERIECIAEAKKEMFSAELEGSTIYDKSSGRTEVKLSFWGKEARTVHLQLPGGRRLSASYSRGDDVVCGRDHAVTTRECLVLCLKISNDRLADKKFLQEWLLSCVELYKKPPENVVEVIALDQSSADWIPEWQTRCVRFMKRSDGAGNGFFLKRDSIRPMLVDASTWSGKELRIYLVIGPPGTGKTELTIWLAGYLRVPLYRLSLNDARLSDQVFAQLVSPTNLRHDNAVIQIDEFQETLNRWKGDCNKGNGVSMGGFCEVLQGSNSLARGFIVLSGTSELGETMRNPAFAAVFRRISIAPTILDWLSTEDLQTFFVNFIVAFVPDCDKSELRSCSVNFVQGPWVSGVISIDMVKQYLMNRISSFRADELAEQSVGQDGPFVVRRDKQSCFFQYLCQLNPANKHISAYPLVGASVSTDGDLTGMMSHARED